MPDPKLVEALGRFAREYHALASHYENAEALAEEFVLAYRIVQLPEEPSAWVPVTEEGVPVLGGVRKRKQDAEDYGLPVRPLYTGDPQEVEP